MEGSVEETPAAAPATPAGAASTAKPTSGQPAATPATSATVVAARGTPRPPVSAKAVPTPSAEQQSDLADEVLPDEVAELAADHEEKQVCRPLVTAGMQQSIKGTSSSPQWKRPFCTPCRACPDGVPAGPTMLASAQTPPALGPSRRTLPQRRLLAMPWQVPALAQRGMAGTANMASARNQRSPGGSHSPGVLPNSWGDACLRSRTAVSAKRR